MHAGADEHRVAEADVDGDGQVRGRIEAEADEDVDDAHRPAYLSPEWRCGVCAVSVPPPSVALSAASCAAVGLPLIGPVTDGGHLVVSVAFAAVQPALVVMSTSPGA